MATRTWTNAAGGSWATGSNWSGGLVPTAADDAVINLGAIFTVTVPAGTTPAASLTMATAGSVLALAPGATLAVPSVALTSGTIRGGTVAGAIAVPAATTYAILDGTTVSGSLKAGSSTAAGYLTLANGLTLAGGTVFEISGLNQDGVHAAAGTTLYVNGAQSITGGTIRVDPNTNAVVVGASTASTLTLSGSTTLDVQGNIGLNNATINGTISVGTSGSLDLLDSKGTAARSTAANATSINVASGGKLYFDYGNNGSTTAELTAAMSKLTVAAGGIVEVDGKISNAGTTLDLTAGSPLSKVTKFNGVTVTGGTIVNNGASAVALPPVSLSGVTLRGNFTEQAGSGTLTVRDGLSVTAADGSAGTLDLATNPTQLAFGAPSVAGSVATISNLTINAGAGIDGGDAAVFAASTTMNFLTGSQSLRGVSLDQGTINVSGKGTVLTVYGADTGPGTFESDGTINVGSGATLVGTKPITNKGTISVGDGGTVSLAAGAAGTIALAGTTDRISFGGPGSSASIVGLTAGDTVAIKGTAGIAATATLSGQVLTVTQGGTTLATLALSDPGKAAYLASDFSATVGSDGTVTVATSHGAPPVTTTPTTPVVTTPTTPTTPIVTTPTTPTTPVVTTPTSNEPYVAYSTSAGSGQAQMTAGSNGGPSYLQHVYIWDRPEGVAMRADAANSFIHGGPGQDALQVTSGTNVLDGGTGSNYMTGTVAGAGTDTFFTDTRDGVVVWNTIINFHQGDAATIWGFNPGVSSYYWDTKLSGSQEAMGATLRANIVGGAGRTGDGIDASVTFAGLSIAQAQSLVHTTGTQGAGNYLYFYNQGV